MCIKASVFCLKVIPLLDFGVVFFTPSTLGCSYSVGSFVADDLLIQSVLTFHLYLFRSLDLLLK